MSSLLSLVIGSNAFDPSAELVLADALLKNSTLTALDVCGWRTMTEEGQQAFRVRDEIRVARSHQLTSASLLSVRKYWLLTRT